MTFKSANSYSDFTQSVRKQFRYTGAAHQEDFLNSLVESCHARCITMHAGQKLWRAQLGHDWRALERDGMKLEFPFPYPPERMKPLPEKAADGPANPKGIPYLYLATERQTAALEVRPLRGSYLSIATFRLLKDLRVIDCSGGRVDSLFRYRQENKTPEGIEATVWSDINRAFSEPVERGDDSIDYVPTQIITGTFKLKGFDGIAYKSGYGEEGLNVALFDLNTAVVSEIGMFRVSSISITLTEEGDPGKTRYPDGRPDDA